MLDRPIILFCSERSGSNLICKIFDAHPAVCAPGASHLFKVLSEVASRYPAGSDTLRRAVLRLFEAKVSTWHIDAMAGARRQDIVAGCDTAAEMAAALYQAECRAAEKRVVMIKENSVFAYLHMLFGQSHMPRVLFMVRDPRDMAVSWIKGPAMRGGVLRATDRWLFDQRGFLAALAVLPAEVPVSFLRYEDLLNATETELRRVCRDLDLDFSDTMLSFTRHSTSAQANAARSSMWSNLDKGLLRDNSNKFQRELDDDAIAYIEAATGPLMSTLGYDTARAGLAPFGGFDSLEALSSARQDREPFDKPAYQDLPAEERARFEGWSQLYAEMTALPVLSPAECVGRRLSEDV